MRKSLLRHRENQNRSALGPALVERDQVVEDLFVGFIALVANQEAPGLLVEGGRRPARRLEYFFQGETKAASFIYFSDLLERAVVDADGAPIGRLWDLSIRLPEPYPTVTQVLIRRHGRDSTLAKAVGNDFKGKVSVVIYLAGIALAFVAPWVSAALYTLAAAWWLVPDRRIEHLLES